MHRIKGVPFLPQWLRIRAKGSFIGKIKNSVFKHRGCWIIKGWSDLFTCKQRAGVLVFPRKNSYSGPSRRKAGRSWTDTQILGQVNQTYITHFTSWNIVESILSHYVLNLKYKLCFCEQASYPPTLSKAKRLTSPVPLSTFPNLTLNSFINLALSIPYKFAPPSLLPHINTERAKGALSILRHLINKC